MIEGFDDSILGNEQYTYDVAGRLTNATRTGRDEKRDFVENFSYDAKGNMSQKTTNMFTAPAAPAATEYEYNQFSGNLDKDDKYNYHYDSAFGNLAFKNTIDNTTANSSKIDYTYDAYNRIIKVQQYRPTNAATATSEATYTYDMNGNRSEKTVDGVMTRYAYNGLNLVAEFDAQGELLAEYQYAPDTGLDHPYSMIRGGAVFYYQYDIQGNVISMTNKEGQVVQRYEYDTFGNIVIQEGNIPNPFTYQGRIWDVEADMYYFRARHYDPHTGRFAQRDPVLAVNPYVFVNNNPVNFGDPLGLTVEGAGYTTRVVGNSTIITSKVICVEEGEGDSHKYASQVCDEWKKGCQPSMNYDSDGNIVSKQMVGGWDPDPDIHNFWHQYHRTGVSCTLQIFGKACKNFCLDKLGLKEPPSSGTEDSRRMLICMVECGKKGDNIDPCVTGKMKEKGASPTKVARECKKGFRWNCGLQGGFGGANFSYNAIGSDTGVMDIGYTEGLIGGGAFCCIEPNVPLFTLPNFVPDTLSVGTGKYGGGSISVSGKICGNFGAGIASPVSFDGPITSYDWKDAY